MRSFTFSISSPGPGEVPISTVRLYESPNGMTGWALVDSIDVGSLTDLDSGLKRWDSDLANPSNYVRLAPVSSADVERPGGVILPPASEVPDTFTVFCWTKDIGMGIASGIRMSAAPAGKTYAKVGSGLAMKSVQKVSDENGYVGIDLPADAGQISVTIDRATVTIDSTGKTGQSVNVADLLP